MGISNVVGVLGDLPISHDVFSIGEQSFVKFYCKGKNKTIRAPLSGSFTLSVQSQWNGLFGGSGGGSTLLGIVDSLVQGIANHSVVQPWFGRKLWGGTTPFKFSLPLRFISRFNAYDEVYLPVVGLLSFMYPRLDNEKQSKAESDSANVFSKYFVPGPNIFYSEGSGGSGLFKFGDAEGDRVEIELGKFISFSACYLTSISLTVENSFNFEGWPHNVAAQVEFEAMDVSFVNFDGSFMENGFKDQAYKLNMVVKEGKKKVGAVLAGEENALTDLFDWATNVKV
jgi:hypothetical protein